MDTRLTCLTVFVLIGCLTTVDACFPYNYWISCLLNTCKLGGTCPGDPTAQCRMEKSDCNGCKAIWYSRDGSRANCSVKQDLKLCPGGEPVVHCLVNPCNWPCDHPDYRGAECRQTFCGSCRAEYLVQSTWKTCPTAALNSTGVEIPYDAVVADGSRIGCNSVPCSIEICFAEKCPAVPRAVCRPDGCNQCKAAWYLDNMRVNCVTGDFIQEQQPLVKNPAALTFPWQRTCAKDEPLVACGEDVCFKKTCRNYPNAMCRPDGCGSCKDTWYVENQLVDCLSDACPSNVPFVKCVDDPCKYFAHYCPSAECRASQCGKCEAKFFSNGAEVDCAQPPKQCPAGIQPHTCPWFTCPANICPSNNRLMCRIDPCGMDCKYEFIDIYTGEIMGCRTFDGEGGPDQPVHSSKTEKVFLRDPLMSLFDSKSHTKGPLFVEIPTNSERGHFSKGQGTRQSHGGNVGGGPKTPLSPLAPVIDPALKQAILEKSFADKATFQVEPVFVNPAPPLIVETDVNGILRAFPHEIQVMSSASIKDALKKHKAAVATNTNTLPLDVSSPLGGFGDQSNTPIDLGISIPAKETIDTQHVQTPLKKFSPLQGKIPKIPAIMPVNTIFWSNDMPAEVKNTQPKPAKLNPTFEDNRNVQLDVPQIINQGFQSKETANVGVMTQQQVPAGKPLYDELNLIQSRDASGLLLGNNPIDLGTQAGFGHSSNQGGVIAEKPSHVNAPVIRSEMTPRPIRTVRADNNKQGSANSVPVNMNLFNQWTMS